MPALRPAFALCLALSSIAACSRTDPTPPKPAPSQPAPVSAPQPAPADPAKPAPGMPERREPPTQGPPTIRPEGPTPVATPMGQEPAPAAQLPARSETDSGLIIEEISIGRGEEVPRFATVVAHYQGTLSDGKEFDSTYARKQPLTVNLAGGAIKGWQEGIPGMRIGGKRRLIVPPELGYGARGHPPSIPPNAMLIFEIEVLEIVR
jgi:FKBP-type peptidyl-prolyl cis-trans isomerase FkpA